MMPFDHVIVVMMENHSFDNLLGALSTSRADVDGLTFGFDGKRDQLEPRNEPHRRRGTRVPAPEHRAGEERLAELDSDPRADRRRRR